VRVLHAQNNCKKQTVALMANTDISVMELSDWNRCRVPCRSVSKKALERDAERDGDYKFQGGGWRERAFNNKQETMGIIQKLTPLQLAPPLANPSPIL